VNTASAPALEVTSGSDTVAVAVQSRVLPLNDSVALRRVEVVASHAWTQATSETLSGVAHWTLRLSYRRAVTMARVDTGSH
jgi:hypothetical protein